MTRPAWALGRRLLIGTYLLLVFLTGVAPELRNGGGFNVNARGENWRDGVAFLESKIEPGDLVLLRSGLIETGDWFRGSFPDACEGYLAAPLSDFYLRSGPERLLLPPGFEPHRLPDAYRERIGRHLPGRGRIWFVLLSAPDPAGYFRSLWKTFRRRPARPTT